MSMTKYYYPKCPECQAVLYSRLLGSVRLLLQLPLLPLDDSRSGIHLFRNPVAGSR